MTGIRNQRSGIRLAVSASRTLSNRLRIMGLRLYRWLLEIHLPDEEDAWARLFYRREIRDISREIRALRR